MGVGRDRGVKSARDLHMKPARPDGSLVKLAAPNLDAQSRPGCLDCLPNCHTRNEVLASG